MTRLWREVLPPRHLPGTCAPREAVWRVMVIAISCVVALELAALLGVIQ